MGEVVVICRKLKVLKDYYDEFIGITKGIDIKEYRNSTLLRRAIEREIQLIVECATDINNMVLKSIDKGPSRDYYNSFIDLGENNVLSIDFALKIAPSTGLRNILVHEYQKVDDEIVFISIDKVVKYYKEYIELMWAYLGCK